ncbi:MAG: thioredoxin family protein [Pseudomonadota bacterium]
MSRKPRKSKKTKKPQTRSGPRQRKPFKLTRRKFVSIGVFALVGVLAFFGVNAYIEKQEVLHDLSAIGQGRPVLVQVHDPKCSMCQRLLSSVDRVMPDYPDVDFRIANINVPSGNGFARRHSVGNVTLILFDARGNKVDTGIGFQSDDEVRSFLETNLKG